ncbi:MAG: DUF5668 domain-containing protein [Acidobacteriia bacterium]|nr:DUF5668 domain-containing protein [Terriglobia bacterium]
MKCAYHPAVESQEFCSTCSRALCAECSHQIKGKVYCQDCLVRGAEWAAAVKDLRIPSDAPKRAAALSLIPGMGAVYNGDYQKAITQFAVFAALTIMGDNFSGVFGFGAFVFLIYTMFDSYRIAEARLRARMEQKPVPESPGKDKTVAAWGILLIGMGMLFLLKNFIHYPFLNRLWPLVFIGLGAYFVYRSLREREEESSARKTAAVSEHKD